MNALLKWAVATVIAALVGGLIYQTLQLAYTKAAHAKTMSVIATAAQQAEERARSEDARRRSEIDKVREDAQQSLQTAAADAAASRRAADSLQQRIDQLLTHQAANHSELTRRGTAIHDLTTLLAQLRREADEYAGELAEIADANRIAGLACERAYASLLLPQSG